MSTMKTVKQHRMFENALTELSQAHPEIYAQIQSAPSVEVVFKECGKVKYGHRETAEAARAAMHAKTGDDYDAYQCLWCDDTWHIGHSGLLKKQEARQ